MENKVMKFYSKAGNNIILRAIPGHFATSHSHINYYVDMTGLKTRRSEAAAVGKAFVQRLPIETVVDTIVCLDGCEVIGAYMAEELEMGYRTSIIKKKGYLVLGAVIVLEQGEQEVIKARMKELTEQRVSKQPLEYPSAGSTFKRPEGYFAGKLIMDTGLRGFQVGGAQISEKHCGFVVNTGDAQRRM